MPTVLSSQGAKGRLDSTSNILYLKSRIKDLNFSTLAPDIFGGQVVVNRNNIVRLKYVLNIIKNRLTDINFNGFIDKFFFTASSFDYKIKSKYIKFYLTVTPVPDTSDLANNTKRDFWKCADYLFGPFDLLTSPVNPPDLPYLFYIFYDSSAPSLYISPIFGFACFKSIFYSFYDQTFTPIEEMDNVTLFKNESEGTVLADPNKPLLSFRTPCSKLKLKGQFGTFRDSTTEINFEYIKASESQSYWIINEITCFVPDCSIFFLVAGTTILKCPDPNSSFYDYGAIIILQARIATLISSIPTPNIIPFDYEFEVLGVFYQRTFKVDIIFKVRIVPLESEEGIFIIYLKSYTFIASRLLLR